MEEVDLNTAKLPIGTSPTWWGVCGSVDIGSNADVAGHCENGVLIQSDNAASERRAARYHQRGCG
jgi:hypothetical protein